MRELSLRELQQESLKILLDVHTFCVKYGMKYSIAYGTLIGAVRHKGFVPWDDDIDVMMPRPDYDRFCKTFESSKYKLIYNGNTKDAILGFARVVECDSTKFKMKKPWTRQESGVWIDVFPIDGVESDLTVYSRRYEDLHSFCKLVYKLRWSNLQITGSLPLVSIFKALFYKLISVGGVLPIHVMGKMNRLIQKVNFEDAEFLGQCAFTDDGPIQFRREDFESYIDVEFEGHKVKAIAGYKHHLTQLYGDYMKLPPKEEQVPKQSYIKFYWKDKS
jgi:lipopolysaccharide cholinephosphotransferase